MSTEQLQLLKQPGPAVQWSEVRRVIKALKGRGWLTADKLLPLLGAEVTDAERRWLRSVANSSKGFILSFPGSPGYRLTTEAQISEIQAAATLRSQANEMNRRWVEIERVYHRKQRLPKP